MFWRFQKMLYSTVGRDMTDDTESDPDYSPKARNMSEDKEVTLGKYIKAPMARVMVERRWRWDGKRRCNQQARSKAPQKNNARKNALFPDARALRDGI